MTHRMSAFARRIALVAAAGALAACGSDSTSPIDTQTDAALAAQTFSQLADSVTRTGGDADMGAAYAGIADDRAHGRARHADHADDRRHGDDFIAAAMTSETTINDCPRAVLLRAAGRRTRSTASSRGTGTIPSGIVQLSSTSNDEQIGAILDPSALALYARWRR